MSDKLALASKLDEGSDSSVRALVDELYSRGYEPLQRPMSFLYDARRGAAFNEHLSAEGMRRLSLGLNALDIAMAFLYEAYSELNVKALTLEVVRRANAGPPNSQTTAEESPNA